MLPRSTQVDGQPVEDFEDRFVSRSVRMGPHDDTSSEVYNILCPDAREGSVRAVSAERYIIYSVTSAGLSSSHQALILISFELTIRFPHLMSLRNQPILLSCKRHSFFMRKSAVTTGCDERKKVKFI
ncbi:hypothetical protein N7448_011335 [Penicillium atrosanguineum]|nr:hypothetical protein N7448_011335 [Penicillium atrosanguineum]